MFVCVCQRGLQVEVMAIESEALVDQLAAVQAVYEEKRALEQRLDELEGELERGQSTIRALEDELYARRSEQETLTAQLQDAQTHLEQQNDQLGELDELRERVRVLSSELDDALALSEEQNAWNQQLANEVERQEQAAVTHSALIRELEARERAFTRRFSQLFEQFAVESELSDGRSLQISYPTSDQGQTDVLKLLQAFPAVVEQYVARCTARVFSGDLQTTVDTIDIAHKAELDADSRWKNSSGRRKGTGKAREASAAVEKVAPMDREGSDASGQFDEQLELIRAAFQAIRQEPSPPLGSVERGAPVIQSMQ